MSEPIEPTRLDDPEEPIEPDEGVEHHGDTDHEPFSTPVLDIDPTRRTMINLARANRSIT